MNGCFKIRTMNRKSFEAIIIVATIIFNCLNLSNAQDATVVLGGCQVGNHSKAFISEKQSLPLDHLLLQGTEDGAVDRSTRIVFDFDSPKQSSFIVSRFNIEYNIGIFLPKFKLHDGEIVTSTYSVE